MIQQHFFLSIILTFLLILMFNNPMLSAEPVETGKCILAKGKTTAHDGSCGTWIVNNTIDRKTKSPKQVILVDFSDVVGKVPSESGFQVPLAIIYVCVVKGHNSFKNDRLIVEAIGNRIKSANYRWFRKREEVGCKYFGLLPGMRLIARMTNIKPTETDPGLGANGTWAIVTR